MAYQSGHFILKIVGTLSLAISGHALAEDAFTFLTKNPPPYVPTSEHSDEYYKENYDYY